MFQVVSDQVASLQVSTLENCMFLGFFRQDFFPELHHFLGLETCSLASLPSGQSTILGWTGRSFAGAKPSRSVRPERLRSGGKRGLLVRLFLQAKEREDRFRETLRVRAADDFFYRSTGATA